ncbi:hypothetical protein BGX28_000161 [Mortierella sp. GBA30]|nr:hypothetical protein BGX28_000161 [Mortierella sp. GBA30]
MLTLGEIDVNEDPILVMSCNHALTISSLDGMMGMSEYYHGDIDPNTGLIAFRSKKPLPQGEIKQVACHVCRKPIMGLLRYGRRIKHAQLSMRMKKFHISQQKPMKDAQEQLKVSNAMAEQHQKEFLAELRKVKAEARPEPPKIHRRKLGRSAGVTHRFPHAELWEISETYGIPTEHETAWRRNLREPFRSFMQFMELSNSALESPTKQLFEAAVSHLYRLKTLPTYDTSQDRGVGHSALVKETPIASDVIQACILECGLPLDGQGGSCYVNSLQGLTNVLLIVLTQAFAAFGHVDASTGWYWLVDDLINCTMTFASIFLEDAEKGKFERHKVYARVSRMNVAYRRMQWLGRKPMPSNEKAKKQRLKRVDETLEAFLSDNTEIRQNCPLGIIQECLSRADVLEEKMEDAYTVARGDALYVPLTEEEKMQVFTAMQQTLLGSGHFYLCPNGHPVG